jgi:HPt (histidine-containing phosphotransfer) domain-containing protein
MNPINSKIEQALVIDRDSLLVRCMGKEPMVTKLVGLIQKKLPTEKKLLADAGGSSQIVGEISHRLRGTASNICANRLEIAAMAAEEAVRVLNASNIDELVQGLLHEIDCLLEELGDGGSSCQ